MSAAADNVRTGLTLGAIAGVAAGTLGVIHLVTRAVSAVNGGTYSGTLVDTARHLSNLPADPAHPARAFPAAAHLPGAGWYYAALLIPIFVLAVVLVIVVPMIRRLVRSDRDESAAWATRRDITPLLVDGPSPSRGILGSTPTSGTPVRGRGRFIATEPNMSTIVFGPSQSGKTRGFAIPRVLEHLGPAIVLSVKTDLAKHTFHTRCDLGKVWVYDPTGSTNLPNRAGWTPLRRCTTWAGAKRTGKWLAGATTTKDAGGGNENAEYFRDRARKLLAPLMFAAAINDLAMSDIVRWVETADQDEPRTLLEESALHNPHLAQHIKEALQAHQAIHTKDGREISGTYSTCEQFLEAYSDPMMDDCRVSESFNPIDLLAGTNTLYLCAPSTEQEYLRPVFATLVKDILAAAFDEANARGGTLANPLLVMLDELANLARIPDLDTLASTCASHGIQLVSIFQSYAQVVDKWGAPRAETIFDNHSAKVLLKGSSDARLLRQFRELLGDEAVEQESTTESAHGKSTSTSKRYRALMAINELRSLPKQVALLLYGEYPPVMLKLRGFHPGPALVYDEPHLTHLSRPFTTDDQDAANAQHPATHR